MSMENSSPATSAEVRGLVYEIAADAVWAKEVARKGKDPANILRRMRQKLERALALVEDDSSTEDDASTERRRP